MVNDPLMQYQLIKAEQRERVRKAEQARNARAAASNAPGWVAQTENARDLTGLVERVIQNIWKRLSLPAREAVTRSEDAWSGRPSGTLRPAHPADMPL
jgi:hypothetical protein